MSQKEDKVLEHHYDGIEEYDNPLPRWWVYLFFLTIVFAIGYCWYFWMGKGDSIEVSFQKKMAQLTGQSVKSSPVVFLHDSAAILAGKALFASKCIGCHGVNGEGIIGPNLTDDYWLHGGRQQDIFTTIKNGVPDKGMISWGATLTDHDIVCLVAFVKSIHGSHPANSKAPQGEKVGDDKKE